MGTFLLSMFGMYTNIFVNKLLQHFFIAFENMNLLSLAAQPAFLGHFGK